MLKQQTFEDMHAMNTFVDKLNKVARKNIYVPVDKEVLELNTARNVPIFEIRQKMKGSRWISITCIPNLVTHKTMRCNFRLRFEYFSQDANGNPMTIRLNNARNASCLSHAFPVH